MNKVKLVMPLDSEVQNLKVEETMPQYTYNRSLRGYTQV